MAESRESISGNIPHLEILRESPYVFVCTRLELFGLDRQPETRTHVHSLKCFKEMTLDALGWVWYNGVQSLFEIQIRVKETEHDEI